MMRMAASFRREIGQVRSQTFTVVLLGKGRKTNPLKSIQRCLAAKGLTTDLLSARVVMP